jgi:hypothetical protein
LGATRAAPDDHNRIRGEESPCAYTPPPYSPWGPPALGFYATAPVAGASPTRLRSGHGRPFVRTVTSGCWKEGERRTDDGRWKMEDGRYQISIPIDQCFYPSRPQVDAFSCRASSLQPTRETLLGARGARKEIRDLHPKVEHRGEGRVSSMKRGGCSDCSVDRGDPIDLEALCVSEKGRLSLAHASRARLSVFSLCKRMNLLGAVRVPELAESRARAEGRLSRSPHDFLSRLFPSTSRDYPRSGSTPLDSTVQFIMPRRRHPSPAHTYCGCNARGRYRYGKARVYQFTGRLGTTGATLRIG